MTKKTLRTIQIVLAIIALVYFVMPDLVIGPFDDGAVFGLIVSAEIVLGIIQALSKSRNPGQTSEDYTAEDQTSDNNSHQYSKNYYYSDNTNYQSNHQENGPANDADTQDDEFQFFAGCNDWEAVKSRYRDLMKIYHPDAGGNEEASKKINAEYNILKERFGRK